jgi:NAD(P)-dependent dehydrogenase (short-subunit alcohol dehydrogenase family)
MLVYGGAISQAGRTMERTNPEPDTTEILVDLLKRAEKAHGLHEKEQGKPDPDWPQWYAEYMTRTLREAGQRISDTRPIGSATQREPELLGQTVVIIGGSGGIGLETARRARAEGAKLILTGRNPERLQRAASELDPLSTSSFNATDPAALEQFFHELPSTIDHVMLTAGRPTYGRLVDMDPAEVRRALEEHLLLALQIARHANRVRPGGTLLFMGGTGARHPGIGLGIASTVTAELPALTASLAIELAPVRVNLIAAGFVDTPLSASLLGDELENRRNQLRASLPIRRVVEPADVALLAVHIMINTALTGATYDVDGGQQFVAA